MLYTSAETDENRIAVANAWASRRGSQPTIVRGQSDREKIALDITILKKQYDKLRERQKQAHIILSSAVSKQHQQQSSAGPSHVNKLLVGKNAIISKGRKGPPKGSIPPVRNQKLVKGLKAPLKQDKPNETLHWNATDEAKKRRNSMTWKELNAERRPEEVKTISKSSSASSLGSANKSDMASPKRRSDSSSYSEDSDCESSPSTSLCDDDITSSLEASPMKKKRHKDLPSDATKKSLSMKTIEETSPPASDVKACPEISISCSDGDNKTTSPIANFYLDLATNLEGGDITSISQLSPMPDISSYFTAISPITTPCNFFEFPDFSSFIINADDKYQVNDEGVTNEFFERVFEENLTTFSTTPDSNAVMSKSFSPSILKACEEETAEHYDDEIRSLSKYIKQKSLSMDEQTRDKEEIFAINRSFSDGTIISVDVKNDGFQQIIAENSKILNKLIPRTFDSPENLVEMSFAKLSIEPTIPEEPKTPNNLSDCEDEIAAIDKIEEADEATEGVMLSDIQDLANIETYSDERDASQTCTANTYTKDENVIEKSEKSINVIEHETLATLACSPLENKSVAEGDAAEQEALTLTQVQPKVEVQRVEEKSESPKFNEIQLMVTKLKEEMESQLKSSEAEIEREKVCEKLNEVKIEKVEIAAERKVEIEEKIVNIPEISVEPPIEKVEEVPPEVVSDVKPVLNVELKDSDGKNHKKTSNTSDDLEKTASESPQKIDKKSSDTILEKLNTQLEMCQKPQPKEVVNSQHEKNMSSKMLDNAKAERKIDSVNLESKYDNEQNINSKEFSAKEVKEVARNMSNETAAVDAKKDSNEILEKLNIQLQRYEETSAKVIDKKLDEPMTSSFSSVKERPSTYETSAVMELAVLIKERELEKLSEQKLAMKTQKDLEYDLSPLRKSNISSPEPSKFNNYFYDHEPRNDTRRRDIITLETDQRIRRPFKSSPTSSLSSSPSNISNTLSSIQNTIKILDSACQKTADQVNIKKLDKAMESVERFCDTDKEWKNYKKNKYEPSPSFKIDDVSFDSHPTKRHTNDDNFYDKTYDLSPRRKRYDFDVDEISFKGLSKDVSPSRFTPKTPEIDPDYVAKLRYLSTEEYIAGRKSPLGGSRENLSAKFKIDRSPTSPVLSTSTHFSRSPRSPSHNSAFLRFPSYDNRSSKSAENSPSRNSGERVETSYKYNSPSGSIDSKAESMSNLSYRLNKKYDWEKPSTIKKYDF